MYLQGLSADTQAFKKQKDDILKESIPESLILRCFISTHLPTLRWTIKLLKQASIGNKRVTHSLMTVTIMETLKIVTV